MTKKATKKKQTNKKEKKRLLRAQEKDSMIGGVCAGIAKYYNTDPTLIRILTVILALISSGIAILAYIAAWIIMPRA